MGLTSTLTRVLGWTRSLLFFVTNCDFSPNFGSHVHCFPQRPSFSSTCRFLAHLYDRSTVLVPGVQGLASVYSDLWNSLKAHPSFKAMTHPEYGGGSASTPDQSIKSTFRPTRFVHISAMPF
jgi:hypothetical protein